MYSWWYWYQFSVFTLISLILNFFIQQTVSERMRMVIQTAFDCFSNLLVELAFIHHLLWKCFHWSRWGAELTQTFLTGNCKRQVNELQAFGLNLYICTLHIGLWEVRREEELGQKSWYFDISTTEQWRCAREVRLKSKSTNGYLKKFHSRESSNDIRTMDLLAAKCHSSFSGETWTLIHLWFLHISLVFPG